MEKYKNSFTKVRNIIIEAINGSLKISVEINDLTLLSDLKMTEFELSQVCSMINREYDIKFSWEHISDIKTIGELTHFYFHKINKIKQL